jgi:hypothetical protein
MTIMMTRNQAQKGTLGGKAWRFAVAKDIATWLLAAVILIAWSAPVRSQEARLMDSDLQKFVGADIVSFCCAVDEYGNEILYVRADVYADMQNINYDNEVSFPLTLQQINKVKLIGGPNEIIHIKYEASPEKTLECKKVNGVYRCYSS